MKNKKRKLNSKFSTMTNEFELIKIRDFYLENKKHIFITAFFILFTYGIKIFNVTFSIDTEAIISVPDSLYSAWLSMGRYGAILIKIIAGTKWFNPYVAAFMLPIGLLFSTMIWGYLFCCFKPKREQGNLPIWVFSSIFITAPIISEQASFLLQAYEVSIAYGLIGLALIFLFKAILQNERKFYLFSIILSVIGFATYQAMILLYIAGVVASFVLLLNRLEKTEKNGYYYWLIIFKLIISFASSYIIYITINKIILSIFKLTTPSYIEGQMIWGNEPVIDTIKSVLKHILTIFQGTGRDYSYLLTFLTIAIIIMIIYKIKNYKKNNYIYILSMLFLLTCPFLMTIVLGATPSPRTEVNVPFVTGFLAMFLIDVCQKKHFVEKFRIYKFAMVVIFIISMGQGQISTRMYYTEYVRYQEDVMLATKISDRVDQLNLGECPEAPVIFIGAINAKRNESTLKSEDIQYLGKSFFEVGISTSHGTFIIQNFLKTLGIVYQYASQEQFGIAEQESVKMGIWPNTDSIKYTQGIIIVRLS